MSATGFTVMLDEGRVVVHAPDGTRVLDEDVPAEEVVGALEAQGLVLADADARAVTDAARALGTANVLQQAFAVEDDRLGLLFYTLSTYLALDDPDALLATMATAVSVADEDGEPLWLLLVGPSSGSKTETIRTQAKLADEQLSDITLAGLMSQRPGGPRSGLLHRLGDNANALVTISDLSSLLTRGGGAGGGGGMSGSQQSGVFEALRDVYDGAYTRTMERVSPSWHGRVTLIAAVTPAIDQMRAHADALGPRWVYFRLNQLDADQRKLVGQMVRQRTHVNEHRAEVAAEVQAIVEDARERLGDVVLDDDTAELVERCADLATYGRATVPRDYRGIIDGVPHWEEPGRLTHQLLKLTRSLIGLNVGVEAARRIVRRAAVSCVPTARAQVLQTLHDEGDWLTTNEVARRTKQHRLVARKALEDWEATGAVEMRVKQRTGDHLLTADDDDEDTRRHDTRPREWRVAADFRDLTAAALSVASHG